MIQQNQQNQHSMPTSFVVVRALFSISMDTDIGSRWSVIILFTEVEATIDIWILFCMFYSKHSMFYWNRKNSEGN